ncbi:conjugative transposon protein TraM [Flagellimonas okinawensis]|uniref:Conjugative transposon protein TraM n=1 Tax=Flagellimonas okinawensis TaxID=3031324 RepID=A0ABT5XSZ5_9FLAO|nr:conjugative transposon protein TraM [[Muricauda] okinawensis]MDF0709038.1 conjugative transposon protein TraM [[Muricauda] okinawensis]
MKARKNKIVFVLVMACVVIFLVLYGIMTFGREKEPDLVPADIPLPDLGEDQPEFDSKLGALEAVKEERETKVPSLYPDHMVDDKGYFNPDYMEYEKQRIIDSIYRSSTGHATGSPTANRKEPSGPEESRPVGHDTIEVRVSDAVTTQELVLAHQLFFASNPKADVKPVGLAHVDGNQIVREGHRLVLRLDSDLSLEGHFLPRGSRIYGFVRIGTNRVMLDIVKIGEHQVSLKAFDLQDGEEGIYVENRLRGEVLESGVDASLGDLNIAGVPQFRGIKRIFQGRNRAIKVAVQHQYQIKLVQKP